MYVSILKALFTIINVSFLAVTSIKDLEDTLDWSVFMPSGQFRSSYEWFVANFNRMGGAEGYRIQHDIKEDIYDAVNKSGNAQGKELYYYTDCS